MVTVSFPSASHKISELSDKLVDQPVVLHGYLGPRSDLSKNISFVQLSSSDLKSSVQLVSFRKSEGVDNIVTHERLKSASQNVPVTVQGVVKEKQRAKHAQSPIAAKRNQEVEISITDIQVLNDFSIETLQKDAKFGLEQRHLQLRAEEGLRDALAFRARAATLCREYLAGKNGFLEIETPLLFKSTPEGAREFLVPTRTKGQAYALPQSPQQYKQILMASGISRYFQMARCFRDEDLRADRQPEFTQVSSLTSKRESCCELMIQVGSRNVFRHREGSHGLRRRSRKATLAGITSRGATGLTLPSNGLSRRNGKVRQRQTGPAVGYGGRCVAR